MTTNITISLVQQGKEADGESGVTQDQAVDIGPDTECPRIEDSSTRPLPWSPYPVTVSGLATRGRLFLDITAEASVIRGELPDKVRDRK